MVTNRDAWSAPDVLFEDVCLLDTIDEAKLSTGFSNAANESLYSVLLVRSHPCCDPHRRFENEGKGR